MNLRILGLVLLSLLLVAVGASLGATPEPDQNYSESGFTPISYPPVDSFIDEAKQVFPNYVEEYGEGMGSYGEGMGSYEGTVKGETPSPNPTSMTITNPNVPITPKSYARNLIGSETQYLCLEKLWTKESNWRWDSYNKSSGAYGIPQALPGSKMSTEGADWKTNPYTQIRWGLKYIAGRYGTPCSAWSHFLRVRWY